MENVKDAFVNVREMQSMRGQRAFFLSFLSRYFSVGPQLTLYIPGPLLREGLNEVKMRKNTYFFISLLLGALFEVFLAKLMNDYELRQIED